MKRNTIIRTGGLLAIIALVHFGTASVRADQQISTRYAMPVKVTCNINETGCDNSPGPQVTLDGTIALGGLQLEMVFANNVKRTHSVEITFSTNIVLVALDAPIVIPKQPVLGGVGGNPHVWLQFYNGKDGDLSEEIYLGRCVQGLSISRDFLNDTLADTVVSSSGCRNHPGPIITFGGDLKLTGLKARFIFRNNLKGVHTAEAKSDVEIIAEGAPVIIPKQPSQGGAGGNPLIWIQFKQGNGQYIGEPIFLGRCNQI